MPVLLIRHAHAGARRDWAGEDRLRPLSDKGRRQAATLPGTLLAFAPQRIFSSPFRRCVETVEPLAFELGLRVDITEELAEGSGGPALALVRALTDEKVALCTHGDVIPDVLVPLVDEDHLDLGPHPKQGKGSVWVLEGTRGRFNRATYLSPPG